MSTPDPLVFIRRTAIAVPAPELFAWHLRPGAFERLLPPGDGTRITSREGRIEANTMRVQLSVPVLGPIRQTWTIRHEGYVPDERFVDVMERGPFRSWRHEHRAVPTGEGTSELVDRIEYELPLGPAGRIAGRPIVERKLAPMFAHRHAITAGDLALHARLALAPCDIHVTGATDEAGIQVVALLLTGGHRVTSDGHIEGYEQPDRAPEAVEVTLTSSSARVRRAGAEQQDRDVSRTGDRVEDPRRILAVVAELMSDVDRA